MKQVSCWLLMGTVILSLCCCAPAVPTSTRSALTPAPTASLAVTSASTAAPTATASPAPTATATPAPTSTPTPTAAPTPTPAPAPTPTPTPTPEPATERSVAQIVEEMAACYARDGERAAGRLKELLAEMRTAYPAEAQKWADVMDRWRALEGGVTVHLGELPDGLPDTDELCIVALGYQLNADGTMKNHLKDRLKVVKRSVRKYPNAWVVCTGGHTASRKKNVSEAGRMSTWLKKNGVSKGRIITEKQSRTTVQNARFTLEILLRDHPQIKYLAIVSGDYHIKSAELFFEAAAILLAESGEAPRFTVVANAACKTSHEEQSTLYRAGGLVELAGDEKVASKLYHDRYDLDKWPPLPSDQGSSDGQVQDP